MNNSLSVEKVVALFENFTSENGFEQVKRSTLVSPFLRTNLILVERTDI